jgi:raffinose/stachyose/melibiose transport system permease protein
VTIRTEGSAAAGGTPLQRPSGALPPGARGTSSRPPAWRRASARRRWVGLLYLAPALTVYVFVVLVPLAQSLNYSLYSWDGVSTPSWVGLSNYRDFFSDPQLREALAHVGVLIVFFALLPIVLGLLSAAILSRQELRGAGVFRSLLFLPQVITTVVTAVVWKNVYTPNGPINSTLRAVGLDRLAQDWLGDVSWALPALGLIGTWVTFGFCMILFISGMQAIAPELYEAARMDGAGALSEFFVVTLPGLRPQIAVALTLTITAALRTFDLVYIATQGGPGSSTTTPALLLYRRAFVNPDVGAAAAIAVVLAVACLIIALAIQRITERET